MRAESIAAVGAILSNRLHGLCRREVHLDIVCQSLAG